MKQYLTRRNVVIAIIILAAVGGFFAFRFAKNNKMTLAINSLSLAGKVSKLLRIENDTTKELSVINQLAEQFTKKDGVTRTFLVFLQNDMELRPGGGFLGQYAIIKLKDGQVISSFFEDANLLDQKITAKITPPYPFGRMMQLKRWKLRDSNFSPDFATNVDKAEYFMRLGGRSGSYDGVIAVNTDVFNNILQLTGPISVPGYNGTYSYPDGALKLEETVEKQYILDPELDTQNRKAIMKKMTDVIIEKLMTVDNLAKLPNFIHKEFQNKNLMVHFKDSNLQSLIESVHWDGNVTKDWGGDYLMLVDANMGALKTDYYIQRELTYDVDLTVEKPTATIDYLYKHTATYGDWRTSDYHTYLRLYTPEGSKFLERTMTSMPVNGTEFGKTYFGVIVHTLINGQTNAHIKYGLPDRFKTEPYKLLIQKQSGVGSVPVKIHVKTDKGDFNQEATLDKDLVFQFGEE